MRKFLIVLKDILILPIALIALVGILIINLFSNE
jgi:hypothetical protein